MHNILDQPEQKTTPIHWASFGKRVGAYLIDRIVVSIIIFVAWAFLVRVLNAISANDALSYWVNSSKVVFWALSLVISWLYSAFQESGSGQATIGKRALGMKITDLEGRRISFLTATGRFLGKLLSPLTLFIGFIYGCL